MIPAVMSAPDPGGKPAITRIDLARNAYPEPVEAGCACAPATAQSSEAAKAAAGMPVFIFSSLSCRTAVPQLTVAPDSFTTLAHFAISNFW